MKPVLFVTGHVPAYRVRAFASLHEHEQIEVGLFGGRSQHGGGAHAGELPFPHRKVHPRELFGLAASGRYRAVVCPTGGRIAPLGTWAGARRGHVPLILWASLWAHPRSLVHALSYLPLRRLYGSADAVVTYGVHVSAYVAARGARNIHVAPQSVDDDFWRSTEIGQPSAPAWPEGTGLKVLFVGRRTPEKGLGVLLEAWRISGLRPPAAALLLVQTGPRGPTAAATEASVKGDRGVIMRESLSPVELRNLYAAADVLVVPSIPMRTFREPWGLVVNEAMNREVAVIASDAVGAAAGGLVRNRANGLVVPAGDSTALARAIDSLSRDPELARKLGRAGGRDLRAFNHEAWAQGFSAALASLGLSRQRW